MEVIDTVQVDSLEPGDVILLDGEELEVISVKDTDDPDEVSVEFYSLSTGDRDTVPLVFDEMVSLLGS